MNFLPRSDEERVKRVRLSFTSMIDVIFLLLIFFMVGMKFREPDREMSSELARDGLRTQPAPPRAETWIVIRNRGTEADPQPAVFIDQRSMRDWDEVASVLHELARFPGAIRDPVILDPAPDAQHGWVMKTLDILRQLHYTSVTFRR